NPALKVIAPEPGGVNLEWIAAYLGAATGAEAPDILALTPARYPLTTEAFWWRCSVLRARVLPSAGPALWAEAPAGDGARMAAAALAHAIPVLLFPPGAAVPPALLPLQGSSYAGWLPVSLEAVGGVFATDDRRFRLDVPLAEGEPAVRDGHAGHCRPGTPAVAPLRVTADTVALDVYGADGRALRPLPELPGGRYTLTFLGSQPVLVTDRQHNPWLHLDVPDGFLFYNREGVPVEITVQLYGARRAQRTGFNLYYDALGGMNNTRWQWLDVGPSQVFTYTLRLTDALFANREGYDFRLCTGGSDENLRIVNVTVKKLAK
ncbi:MAG TPA: hypothetical protein PK794_01485, partial [Armatimonadota bacterium]|nr:hypothetical protein [Armatimonadota bacterium]